jgi:hypothetical protein
MFEDDKPKGKPKRKRKPDMWRLARWLMAAIVLVMAMTCVCSYLWSYFGIGMFTRDCVEDRSAGGITVMGVVQDISGNPMQGVQIRVIKAEGGCPQSMAFDTTAMSDEQGSFATGGWTYLGDLPVDIEIAAVGYGTCRFSYDISGASSTTIELTVTLSHQMTVDGRAGDSEDGIIDDFYFRDELHPC